MIGFLVQLVNIEEPEDGALMQVHVCRGTWCFTGTICQLFTKNIDSGADGGPVSTERSPKSDCSLW